MENDCYRGEVEEGEPLTRQNIDNRTDTILNNLKKEKNIDEKLQSYGITAKDIDAILTTIIRYTLGSIRVPVLPANIPAKSNELVDDLVSDNPALLRFLQKSGLNPIQSRRLLADVIVYTLEAILPPNL
jgi:hypothetical protein